MRHFKSRIIKNNRPDGNRIDFQPNPDRIIGDVLMKNLAGIQAFASLRGFCLKPQTHLVLPSKKKFGIAFLFVVIIVGLATIC